MNGRRQVGPVGRGDASARGAGGSDSLRLPGGVTGLGSEARAAARDGKRGRPGKGGSGPGWAAGTGDGSAGFCVGAGPSGREMGRARGEEGESLGQLTGWADFWVWAGFGFPISLVFLSFLFQTHSNYFEFKRNLNSTLGTQPNKTYALA